MSDVARFEFLLVIISAILILALVARRLSLPPSAAFIAGGLVMALIPGAPSITLDPDLVLVIFLPPLLMSSAYFTVWASFRANLVSILNLAVGAVLFSTLAVGCVTRWLAPGLPWSVCFALGAILAPPDAVAAKSVLERVRLPERLSTLLEGESLLNDASSIVVYRVAIAAFLTGTFSITRATTMFGVLSVGGVALGLALGWAAVFLIRRIGNATIVICLTLLLPWVGYVTGERLGVSGVMATVTMGLLFGWHQHEVFPAKTRRSADAFWEVLTFLLEALIFVMIGLSLHSIAPLDHEIFPTTGRLVGGVAGVVLATIVVRFIWAYGATAVDWARGALRGIPHRKGRWGEAAILGWAGMRGVVSLAVALSTPEDMPGRNFVLLTTFTLILVTVVVQGGTLSTLIRWTGVGEGDEEADGFLLTEYEARARMATAQREAIEKLAVNEAGDVLHPRLLEQYRFREGAATRYSRDPGGLKNDRDAHYAALKGTIVAGRSEILKLHRAGKIHDHVLRRLETELDLQQLALET
ncbi:Na+/H+ antiporter [Acetobacter sp. DsW_063]|uniref:Na+/H+ antiporter n=1 Tax=Acetobacter sp. DsW_063 TaxID=1514894 RepID=UPI000A3840CD|nr:Na+/H+ antiporter [Acetobacter sp. DsW_063]OUJ13792.1 sodium:proton antiporter [Acetobacter sp. DsW_063]